MCAGASFAARGTGKSPPLAAIIDAVASPNLNFDAGFFGMEGREWFFIEGMRDVEWMVADGRFLGGLGNSAGLFLRWMSLQSIGKNGAGKPALLSR